MNPSTKKEKWLRLAVLNVVILSVIIGIIFLAKFDWGKMLSYLIAVPMLLLFPRWFYRKKKLDRTFNHTFITEIELVFLMGVSLTVLGENFLYQNVPLFDSFVHLVNGMLLVIVIVSFNHERWLDKRFSGPKTVFFAGFLPVILNEFYEASADQLFGTKLWGDAFKPLMLDTVSDIVISTLGSVLAVIILKKYFHYWLERWRVRSPQEQPPEVSPH